MTLDYNTAVFNAHARAAGWDMPGPSFNHDPFQCGMFYIADFRKTPTELSYFAVKSESFDLIDTGDEVVLTERIATAIDNQDTDLVCNSLIAYAKAVGIYGEWLLMYHGKKFHAVGNIIPVVGANRFILDMAAIPSDQLIIEAELASYVAASMKEQRDLRR
jgi:hypothetical protein